MEENVLVSVVMLTYNHEKYIEQAVESILFQRTTFRYEIIIGDDCSEDKTPDILRKYGEKYPELIKVFYQEKNVGCTANLISVYKHAKGKYIAHLEGDDFWICETKLQQQFDYLEANPQISAVTNKCKVVDENGKSIYGKIFWVKEKELFTGKDFDGVTLPGQTSSLFQRNIFINNPEKLACFLWDQNVGDRISVLLLLEEGNIVCFQNYMSAYRFRRSENDKNVSSSMYHDRNKTLLTDINLYVKMLDYANKHNVIYNSKRLRQRMFVRCIRACLTTNNKERRITWIAMKKLDIKWTDWFNLGVYFIRLLFYHMESLRPSRYS